MLHMVDSTVHFKVILIVGHRLVPTSASFCHANLSQCGKRREAIFGIRLLVRRPASQKTSKDD